MLRRPDERASRIVGQLEANLNLLEQQLNLRTQLLKKGAEAIHSHRRDGGRQRDRKDDAGIPRGGARARPDLAHL